MPVTNRGFVSLPFLVLFSICISLCAYLSLKSIKEAEMLVMLEKVNQDIQKEKQILEHIYCIIQCPDSKDQMIEIDGEEIWLDFEGNVCFTEGMIIEFDLETGVIVDVQIE